jgi:hypothetical protein
MGTLISIIVLAALVIVAAGVIAGRSRKRHSQELREKFGPEYDRTVELAGTPRAAEQELAERQRRHENLDLHPLSEDTRIDYLEHWREAQALFVDNPAQAIDEADVLIRHVMRDRGYHDGDFDQRIGDVSVDYPEAVERYRTAHDVAIRARVGDASTEELREALTNYRGLFDELVTKSAPHEVR